MQLSKGNNPTTDKKTKRTNSKKGNVIAICLSVLLVISILINVLLAVQISIYEKNSPETVVETSDITDKVDAHTNSNENTIITDNIDIDINSLKAIGSFTSIKELKKALQRNIDNPQHMKLQITGYIIRTDSELYVCTIDDIGVEERYNIKEYLRNDDAAAALNYIQSNKCDNIINIYMYDDTANRVLTGDQVEITGILDTTELRMYNCIYEFVE